MSDQPDNILLVIVRRIDAKLDRLAGDVNDLKVRVSAVEEAVAGVHRRLDRLDIRVERMERRLDLIDAPLS